jgi:hypothetical protein
MSVFSNAILGLKEVIPASTKYWSEARAFQVSSRLAYAPKIGAIGAGIGAVGGAAAGGRDHRMRGAMAGAGVGALAGFRGIVQGPAGIKGLLGSGRIRGNPNPYKNPGPIRPVPPPTRLRLGAGNLVRETPGIDPSGPTPGYNWKYW